ncbi:FYN-binding protein 1 isoform X2 [Cheilinus undulatus]|uniref:FYN-binding protein 1 isoform X2 n=1 Tax=Cheilinus undulatus TaxID=241271 RepID=UPI001BD28836|nr:FYN-binding protein 1 isoform X2 [Cheilinus undulatus]
MSAKGDVKAMMARFQTGGSSTDETSSTAVGRPKQPLHPTLSSGPTIPTKKPVLESLSGSAANTPSKPPAYLKNTVSTKSDTDVHEPNKTKALANRFGSPQDDSNTKPFIGNKQQVPFKLPVSQASDNKGPVTKPPFNKPTLTHTMSDPKPAFPKPSPAAASKPSWVKEDSGGGVTSSTPSKVPLQHKPPSSLGKLRHQNEETAGSDAANKLPPMPKSPYKPTPGFKNSQNMFNKEDKTQPSDDDGAKKPPLSAITDTASKPPPIPNSTLKPTSSFRNTQNMFNKDREKAEASDDAKTDGAKKPPRTTNTDAENKPPPIPNSTIKPASSFRNTQNMFNKEREKNEPSDGGMKTTPPPKPPASKKPSIKRPSQTSKVKDVATSGPKQNPLPNSLALGPAPAKPNRPPKVNLENFKRGAEAPDEGPGTLKKPFIPTPQPSHPSNNGNNVTPAQPLPPALPSLPPRHPAAMVLQDECYDDVDEFSSPPPPPLPSSAGHPSQRKEVASDDDDGEMYEDLDDRWEAAEKPDKNKEKEEKKRLEAEKKEQKEREKKEQDARKKFKLVGPLEVIHQGKARVDCRGGKTDLGLKQGDSLDIIRVQGNPEGKWLGRTQDGSIGYVKTTSVEIDFNSLKNHKPQQAYDPEVYDDVDVALHDNSGSRGPGVVLPPLPGEDGEIYDDVVDPNLDVRVPPPSQFTAEVNSDQQGAAVDEEIYDDVDSQNAPQPPSISSLLSLKGKIKADDSDSKRQKKLEKEEKEFRKKFKYEGEIQVLYQVTIIPTLNTKKWSSKDLPVKAGEKLDVIVKAEDNKLVCRNEDGKFGYVLTSHIATDDGDIYDDIGDDCIYDND